MSEVLTLQVPDRLIERLRPLSPWLPAVLELSLVGFKTKAVRTASELITFLSAGPTVEEVASCTVSDEAQQRLRRLLALNESGLLSEEEQAELDEIEQIEHIMVMLKADARKQMAGNA
jgi:hypothetical protein